MNGDPTKSCEGSKGVNCMSMARKVAKKRSGENEDVVDGCAMKWP